MVMLVILLFFNLYFASLGYHFLLINFHKQISNDTNLNIKLELMNKGTEKDIARRNNVSFNHVNRISHNISEDKLVKNNGTLPSVLGRNWPNLILLNI